MLDDVQIAILKQAHAEGFITDDTVAIDSTHIEARDQPPVKQKKEKTKPKKRGRKSKMEHEARLQEQKEKAPHLSVYEKKIDAQLKCFF